MLLVQQDPTVAQSEQATWNSHNTWFIANTVTKLWRTMKVQFSSPEASNTVKLSIWHEQRYNVESSHKNKTYGTQMYQKQMRQHFVKTEKVISVLSFCNCSTVDPMVTANGFTDLIYCRWTQEASTLYTFYCTYIKQILGIGEISSASYGSFSELSSNLQSS